MRIFDKGVRFPDVDLSCGLEPSLREILVYYYRQAFAADEAAALANKYIDIVGVEAEVARLRAEADALRVKTDNYNKFLAELAEACEDIRLASEECDIGEGLAHAVPFHQWNEFLGKLDAAEQFLAENPIAKSQRRKDVTESMVRRARFAFNMAHNTNRDQMRCALEAAMGADA